jgi:hypothetical protein
MYQKLSGTDINQKVTMMRGFFGNWYLLGQVYYKSLNAFEVNTPMEIVYYPSNLCYLSYTFFGI